MNIVLLNWSKAENDPFSCFSKQLAARFAEIGVSSSIVELGEDFGSEFMKACRARVDFAVTWQGLASRLKRDGQRQLLWEELGLHLFCLHGDHPCHMPDNHATDSDYVTHLYGTPSFAEYANRHFVRKRPAVLYRLFPNIFPFAPAPVERSGDYFVFPKNLEDVSRIKEAWQRELPKTTADFFLDTAAEIERCYEEGDPLDHHALVDRKLANGLFSAIRDELAALDEAALLHDLHASLDKIYRNAASERVVRELTDFPLMICGRGWDRFKKHAPAHHQFCDFETLETGEKQYRSKYGVIDVGPVRDSLHDRTFRAVANGSGFLSNSQIDFTEFLGGDFRRLFYSGRPGHLSRAAEQVLKDPSAHTESAVEFGRAYDRKCDFHEFSRFLLSFVH